MFFAIIVTMILYQLQQYNIITNPDGTQTIATVVQEKEVDLNTFLELYNTNTFDHINIHDSITLEWYQKLPHTNTVNSMMLRQSFDQNFFSLYKTKKPAEVSILDLWLSLTWETKINIFYNEQWFWSKLLLDHVLPLIFFVLFIGLIFKFFGPKAGGIPFNISAGKLKSNKDIKTKFSDIAGMEECKNELQEVVEYLKNPEKYLKIWARPPKWILLHWVPGWWKTLLARAVAGEANVPFFSASGSEFMEMLVGMGAAKVRELFTKAKAMAPAIIFIDEIDAIGRRRGSWHTGWHQEQEQTLNQILTEMDGFDTDTKVIVIAATNRPDTLDPALLRSWRFDRKVMVGRPTLDEREKILEYYLSKKKITWDVSLASIAKRTSGFVGADIENLVNEAALKVAKEDRDALSANDFEYALEKIIMGPEKKIKTLREHEKNIVTYHELGHAVTAFVLPHADPVEKISIVSRGMALGVTWMMPDEDKYLHSKSKFLDEAVTLLWWRAAEEIFFGKDEITTWASNDFERATKLISDMILKYGMSEELGPVMYSDSDKSEMLMYRPYSEKTAEKAEQIIKTILNECYAKAKNILLANKKTIEKLAQVLLKKEYLNREEFEQAMKDPASIKNLLADTEFIEQKLTQESISFIKSKLSDIKPNTTKNKKIPSSYYPNKESAQNKKIKKSTRTKKSS